MKTNIKASMSDNRLILHLSSVFFFFNVMDAIDRAGHAQWRIQDWGGAQSKFHRVK